MSDAMLLIKFSDGTAFRWRIPEKYGWKLFFEKWKDAVKEEIPKTENSDDFEDDEFRLD